MAAAQPEYELSIEMTTGMSPPPMAMTRCNPSTSDTAVRMPSGSKPASTPSVLANHTMRAIEAMTMMRLRMLRPGSVRGLPEMRAASLR